MGNCVGSKGPKKDPKILTEDEIKLLLDNTRLTRAQIVALHANFLKECPTGKLTKKDFVKLFKEVHPSENKKEKADKFCEYVFKVIDVQNLGYISFQDFVLCFSLTSDGDFKQKCEFAFRLYDLDKDGKISKKEMTQVLTALYDLSGITDRKGDNAPAKKVEDIIKKINATYQPAATDAAAAPSTSASAETQAQAATTSEPAAAADPKADKKAKEKEAKEKAKKEKEEKAKKEKEEKERLKKEKEEKAKKEKEEKEKAKKEKAGKSTTDDKKEKEKPAKEEKKEKEKPAKEEKKEKEKPVKEKKEKPAKPAKAPKAPEYITKEQFIDACSTDEQLKKLFVDSIFSNQSAPTIQETIDGKINELANNLNVELPSVNITNSNISKISNSPIMTPKINVTTSRISNGPVAERDSSPNVIQTTTQVDIVNSEPPISVVTTTKLEPEIVEEHEEENPQHVQNQIEDPNNTMHSDNSDHTQYSEHTEYINANNEPPQEHNYSIELTQEGLKIQDNQQPPQQQQQQQQQQPDQQQQQQQQPSSQSN